MERLICLLIGYGFGLFQTSVIIGKVKGFDIRKMGSGNAGTTNMLRNMGIGYALATLAGDLLKCVFAILLCTAIFRDRAPQMLPLLRMYAGIGAVLGHDFPFYLHFRGGKGVATTAGLILAFNPLGGVICISLFFVLFFLTHLVSLCSLTAYTLFFVEILVMGLTGQFHMTSPLLGELYLITFLLVVLCFWQHRGNLKKLAAGTEKRTYLHHDRNVAEQGK